MTTVAVLTIGMGLNGGIYSGFKINHLDITPRFAGFLMSLTNCTANLAGLLAPIAAGNLIDGNVSHRAHVVWMHPLISQIVFNPRLAPQPSIAQWQIVFFIAAGVYVFCATFYNIFGSGERQPWDNPMLDDKDPTTTIPIHVNGGHEANGTNGNAITNGVTVVSETRT